MRSLKVAYIVVPVSRRMVHLNGDSVGVVVGSDGGVDGNVAEAMRDKKPRGRFCMVSCRDWLLQLMVTQVTGGKGLSDEFVWLG